MEYGSTVWSHRILTCWNLFCRAARWIKSKYDSTLHQWSKSSDKCLKELKWPTLASCWLYHSVAMLYSIMNNQCKLLQISTIILDFITNATWSHPLTLQTRSSSIEVFLFVDIQLYHLYGTQFHMKIYHHHQILSDHGSDNIYLADTIIFVLVCVFVATQCFVMFFFFCCIRVCFYWGRGGTLYRL